MDERLEQYEQLWSEGYMKFVPDLLEYARNLENKVQELEEEIERTDNSFANAYMQYQKQYERVKESERDRAEWEIESHTQNARNKRLEHQFNELYRKHFIKVDQLEKQNQRYKEVKGQLEAIYDAEDMENPIIKNEYIGGYLQGLDRAIDLLEYAQEGES